MYAVKFYGLVLINNTAGLPSPITIFVTIIYYSEFGIWCIYLQFSLYYRMY